MSIFMSYAGIKGEVSDRNHKGWIDIAATQMSSLRKITANSSTQNDRESSVAQLEEIHIERFMDSASPDLFMAHTIGKGQNLVLHFTKTGAGSGADMYLELTLKHALISSYRFNAQTDSPARPLESLRVSYAAIEYKYVEFDQNGNQVAPRAFGFDPTTNSTM